MNRKTNLLDLVLMAVLKLDMQNGEWQNVMAFIQSCYCGRVRTYDFERALESLGKLTAEEHHALVEHTMRVC